MGDEQLKKSIPLNSRKWNRDIIIVIFLTLSLCVFSCKNTGGSGEGDPINDGESIRSSLSRETNPQLQAGEMAELAAGNTRFACDLYEQVRNSADNVFFSPHSITTALAMAYAGARGNTAAQMAAALHFTLSPERLHNAFNALDLELAKRPQAAAEDGFELNICNAAWGQKDYSFLQDYLDLLAVNYDSGLRLLDFTAHPEQGRITINDWVYLQTEERIENLLPTGSINELTRLVLTNTIYFKAGWRHPFDEEATADAPFFTLDGQQVTASMMQRRETFAYTGVEGYYQAVELLYKGEEVSMVVLLPAADRFVEFETALDAGFLNNIIGNLSTENLILRLPKFSFEWKQALSDVFKALGMTDAFEWGPADFSGIDGGLNLYISNIFHQSFVAVDEKGTEAAAATAVVINYVSAPDTFMTVNRPFIFLIRDWVTGVILFMGRVLNPAG
ncbi:MAG: serpin family protein [Candidatus Aminicenantes bacterium]|nr:serpin family protein [Candidatus Aminicenantes bacterium]